MESFYRHMRKKHNVLLDNDDKPEHGRWNFDRENRKRLPDDLLPPSPFRISRNISEIVREIRNAKLPSIGAIDPDSFRWPANRKESLGMLDHFLNHLLPFFGSYQDAMSERSVFLYHSVLSFSLNTKMIHPSEVVLAVENHWRENQDIISISQAEGFIRQVLGWREYMRGIYWAHMPIISSA